MSIEALFEQQALDTAAPPQTSAPPLVPGGVEPASNLVNDTHSQLNATRVDRVVAVGSEAALAAEIAAVRREGKAVCIAGGRHAMGGEQVATGAGLLDMRPMKRHIAPARAPRLVDVAAGAARRRP